MRACYYDILVRIRIQIRRSMPLTNGSGSGSDPVHLHHFSKIKSKKESQNSRNQGFFHDNRGIQIREAQKHVEPVDPNPDSDLQHCMMRVGLSTCLSLPIAALLVRVVIMGAL
jgi:hypothetical protein